MTIVEALPTLVPLEDPWAAKLLERAFRKRKIAFKTGVRFQGVTQDDSGVTVTLEDGTTVDVTERVVVADSPEQAEEIVAKIDAGEVA